MSETCFVTESIMRLFNVEKLTTRDVKYNGKLSLFRMHKADFITVGFVVKVNTTVCTNQTISYRWHDTFNEAYNFYHNYDIDLNKQI